MLTEEEVRHIALLARIGIKEEEITQYQQNLSSVLDFFRALEKLPTDTIQPIEHIAGTVNVARTDQSQDFESSGKAGIVKNVPMTKDGYVKVKSVF
ncbi:MAG TPA: Asp-tRNA(Asn)/Glu-tRNA(Gln) amidotransferase subunit GatC [Patescibacteria group bacterium]|nr:Asp-tRNA(Asn)/Glu-tRNA(Gln) amidotransferase subunit GatC [Patescibacteria group bacterium]